MTGTERMPPKIRACEEPQRRAVLALLADCGLPAAEVGRFEIHDRWTFLAVASPRVVQALKGLARHGVKGRRIRAERVSFG